MNDVKLTTVKNTVFIIFDSNYFGDLVHLAAAAWIQETVPSL